MRARRSGPLPDLDLVHSEERGQPRQPFAPKGAKLSSSGPELRAKATVALFSFTLAIEGADILTDDAIDALYEAGCDDATFGFSDGVQTGEFDREARDFAEAVASAIKAVEAAVPGALVVDVHRELEAAAAG